MRDYFLKPLKKTQGETPLALSVSPSSLTLDRVSPGNTVTFTASLNRESSSPVVVTVSSSDPSATVSPAQFSLGGTNPINQTVTITGATTGPVTLTIQVSAPGMSAQTIAVNRPAIPLDFEVSPSSLTLDRVSPGNVSTVTVSLNQTTATPVAMTVSTGDPSVSASPATFSLGGTNPINQTVTLTGTSAGPDSVSVQVSGTGLTTRTIAISRPPVPLELTVTPTSLVLDRVSPGNVGTVTAALNRVPDSAVLVNVSSSDQSVAVFPASFSLSTGNPPSRAITLTGSLSGPNAVTISVSPLGLAARTVSVTRPAFTPNMITGLALWLDASDAATLTLDGSNNVSQWNDKSGNANHGTQATTTLRPSGNGLMNGRKALDFDGVDDFLQIANSATIDLSPTMSIFVVHKTDSTSARQTIFSFQDNGASATPMIELGTVAGTYTRSYSVIRPGVFMLSGPTDALTTSPTVLGFLVDSSANLSFRKNGVEIATTASAGATLVASGTRKLIGSRIGTTQLYDGLIGEIVVYNKRLSATEISQIESYLVSKWGVV